MSHDTDFLQQYLGELNTQAPNAGAQPSAPTQPGTHSEHSSQGHGPTHEQSKPQEAPGTAQQSGEGEGQSTGPSGDSEAGASPHVKEGLQQDTGNSDSKTAKHAAKLRSQDLQEKNRKAQRRFRERQKVSLKILEAACSPLGPDVVTPYTLRRANLLLAACPVHDSVRTSSECTVSKKLE